MINLFTKPIHDTALLLIGDKSSINKIVSHSSCRTKYRARRVNHRTSPLLAFPSRKNLTVATNAKELFSLEKSMIIGRFLLVSRITNLSRRYIWGGGKQGRSGGRVSVSEEKPGARFHAGK